MRPSIAPVVTASGSGPLSSLRVSKPSSSLFELKNSGLVSAVMRSKSSPLSKTRAPVAASQIENERVPKAVMRS